MYHILSIITAGAVVLSSVSGASAESHKEGHHGQGGKRGGHMLERLWSKADSNQDGMLTMEEFHQFHTHHFNAMDKNKDGMLSKEETEHFHEERKAKHKGHKGEHHHH